MVTSATYRQAAVDDAGEAARRTRDNRLLSRGPRFRMDAEMIRDYALAASGLLVRKIGGPSVKPYQPDGVWEAVAHDRQQHARLQARHRREPVSPQHVHVLETCRAAGVDGHLQRAEPRNLHRPPRTHQHAACRRW